MGRGTQMKFTISGHHFDLSGEDVVRAMKGVQPGPVYQHAVQVGDGVYPVKQVLARVTKLDRLDFTSATSRRVLKKLGFRLFRQAP
jgi:hypothetical protein